MNASNTAWTIGTGSPHLGIAGVNTRPLHAATLGIAGNWGSTLRLHVDRVIERSQQARPVGSVGLVGSTHLGDRAAEQGWSYACYFLDYTFASCPQRSGGMRYRPGFRELCHPERRRLPVFLDSAAYREATGTAPRWSSYERYCQAIELIRPDGAMAKDTIGDQVASREGYQRLCRDGYADVAIPVWQARPAYIAALSPVANGRLAVRDPVLRAYVDRSPLVAIGGLVRGPCPRAYRHLYLAELCRAFPHAHWWAMGQASGLVINGLGSLGLLDRVHADGTWWLHHARTEQIAVLEDGLIRSIRLTHTGATSFFTLVELMASNLRALLSAYAGLWTFPAPAPVPLDLRDREARLELKQRLRAAQLDLFDYLPASSASPEVASAPGHRYERSA